MMKRLLTALIAVCLAMAFVMPVAANENRVVDDADLLTSAQVADLERTLSGLSRVHHMDIVIVTVDNTGGKSPMAFADDYYDYNDYNFSGVLLLISIGTRDLWISTKGDAIRTFSDAGIDYIGDRIADDLHDGYYYEAFQTFAGLCDDFMTKAENGSPYDRGNLPKGAFPLVKYLIISVIVGFVISGIINLVNRAKNKSVRANNLASDYVIPGSLQITSASDVYLYSKVSSVRRQSSSSGGSSVHRSSSGSFHGGGGRKF